MTNEEQERIQIETVKELAALRTRRELPQGQGGTAS